MSYLKVTNDCSCADYLVPLRAIKEVLVPKGKGDLEITDDAPSGEYVITVKYLENDQYTMKFCEKCWIETESVIGQLKQVVRGTLISETA